jgi:predicted RNA-binding Zn ribbon-like protein
MALATSKAAPGELDLVRAFVNTLDIEHGPDELGTSAGAAAWLRGHGLLEDGLIDDVERERVVAVREALRELLLANNDGHTPAMEAVATLRAAAARAPLAVDVAADGAVALAPVGGGVDAALGRLLAITYRAAATGEWRRLKACRDDRCRWAFYDGSRNRSGHWCSMAVCGNRNKVRGYRSRQAGGEVQIHVHHVKPPSKTRRHAPTTSGS